MNEAARACGLPDHGEGLAGKPFTIRPLLNIERPIRPASPLRSTNRVRFYGAIGSPASAEVMGEARHRAHLPVHVPRPDCWRRSSSDGGSADRRKASGAILPISVKMFIADTDEEARELGRRYYPAYFSLQADHYEADANPWAGIPEYTDFSRMFTTLRTLANPAELGPFLDSNLVGSVETICKRIDALTRLGFNYFMVSCATPGTPFAVRQQMMTKPARSAPAPAMRRDRVAGVDATVDTLVTGRGN
jgi:alkanesulfonate monooxygenase SsuD/methylene tetrahydromethanopterin reductase-like flavin-dependent oxidoreductase (luciferase family)